MDDEQTLQIDRPLPPQATRTTSSSTWIAGLVGTLVVAAAGYYLLQSNASSTNTNNTTNSANNTNNTNNTNNANNANNTNNAANNANNAANNAPKAHSSEPSALAKGVVVKPVIPLVNVDPIEPTQGIPPVSAAAPEF
jgi:uncharacterized protein HemX